MVSFLTKDCYRPAKISGKNALGEKKTVTILQDAYDAQKKLVNFLCIVAATCILNPLPYLETIRLNRVKSSI